MLLCVAGGGAAEFPRDRPSSASRCSLQSRVMVEERSSMTSSSEQVTATRSKVIVVSGGDTAPTCATTTTFRSSVVNGKRGTNTILVRYKPSRTVEDDLLQFEFCNNHRHDAASSIASDGSSGKDKTSTSAWAQIMELEGYRSPAIGLDNGPSKLAAESDSISNTSSLSLDSFRSDVDGSGYVKAHSKCVDLSSATQMADAGLDVPASRPFEKGLKSDYDKPKLSFDKGLKNDYDNQTLSFNKGFTNDYDKHTISFNKGLKSEETVSYDKGLKSDYDKQNVRSTVKCRYVKSDERHTRAADKGKSTMLRSESSRLAKVHTHERNKSRRKTLPDGNLSLNSDKSQKSPEHDPNASWGRYNSRAMRDSVRKVAETVYLKRPTRMKLDSLPEAKDVHVNLYPTPFIDKDASCKSKHAIHVQSALYGTKRASSTSHLHEIPRDAETALMNRNRLHVIMPTRHDHSHVHSSSNRLYFPRDVKVLNPKHHPFSHHENGCVRNETTELDSMSSSTDSKNSSELGCDKLTGLDIYLSNKNCQEAIQTQNLQGQMIFTHASVYHPPPSPEDVRKFDMNISSIDCKISSDMQDSVGVSVSMQDFKSKLCADCALSTQHGPPSKQSACRANHHVLQNNSKSNLLKRSSLAAYDGDSSSPYLRLYQRKGDKVPHAFENTPRRCTMLTAREMTELVHGNGSGKLTDPKLSQAGVTSKVSNWIQKQKDKRKPVFFIGDAPSFFVENSSETDNLESNWKSTRKSRRSLSLSSVREDVSTNTNGVESKVRHSGSRLRPTANNENSFKHEHKGLYIKRASSCCSNRDSSRKDRQDAPSVEENQYMNCEERNYGSHEPIYERVKTSGQELYPKVISSECTNFDLKPLNPNEIYYGTGVIAASKKTDSTLDSNVQSFFDMGQSVKSIHALNDDLFISSKVHVHPDQNLVNEEESLGSQGFRHSYSPRNADADKPERTSLQKKLLNFKQITRALSLHSLKKKSKDLPLQDSETPNSLSDAGLDDGLPKSNRGSKKRIDSVKYGSLRKSLSYCELTARGSKVSGKLEAPVKSLSIEKKIVKRPAAKIPPRSCTCASLRRSVSLYWQFPLSSSREPSVEDPRQNMLAKICFSRLHRRNTVLPFLREVKRAVPSTSEKKFREHHSNTEHGIALDNASPGGPHPSLVS